MASEVPEEGVPPALGMSSKAVTAFRQMNWTLFTCTYVSFPLDKGTGAHVRYVVCQLYMLTKTQLSRQRPRRTTYLLSQFTM